MLRPESPSAAQPVQPPRRPLRLDAALLFRAGPEIEIVQGEAVYRLRRTKAGKLILTK
ncbi:hemin uptake protein HemP [Acetobacteraceae bacterium H6797]|nr:hemin uptake protein HemP [Acetobacteraceae bacterium H6797]